MSGERCVLSGTYAPCSFCPSADRPGGDADEKGECLHLLEQERCQAWAMDANLHEQEGPYRPNDIRVPPGVYRTGILFERHPLMSSLMWHEGINYSYCQYVYYNIIAAFSSLDSTLKLRNNCETKLYILYTLVDIISGRQTYSHEPIRGKKAKCLWKITS